jgi:hypothetical protein
MNPIYQLQLQKTLKDIAVLRAALEKYDTIPHANGSRLDTKSFDESLPRRVNAVDMVEADRDWQR